MSMELSPPENIIRRKVMSRKQVIKSEGKPGE